MTDAPAISVVVPSHDRALRLRWLLNALEEQTLDRSQWEVIVAHDSTDETASVLATHPLTRAGVLRSIAFAPGAGGPSLKRNAGFRAARAPVVAFTDDDCRPPPDWVAGALAAALAHPGAIVQGRTEVDPDELAVKLSAPYARSQEVSDPPQVAAQTCNIVYPVAVLEACDGFDESLPLAAGEDTDLALRARAAGTPYAGEPSLLMYHCVEDATLRARMREVWRWQHLPFVVKRHPHVRDGQPYGGWFWKPSHAGVPFLLAAAVALARRRPLLALLLALPWVRVSLPSYGGGVRGRLRTISELPPRAAIDLVEFAALARGSVRYRSLLL